MRSSLITRRTTGVSAERGANAAAKELGNVDLQFVEPADGSALTQKKDVDDLLSKDVKGIAISPKDPANQTPYLNSVAAKVNLITSDSDAANSNRLCYIGTDNHAAGVMAGGLLKEALPQRGQSHAVCRRRRRPRTHKTGFPAWKSAIKGTNIQVIGVRTDDTDRTRAKKNASDAIVSNPDLAAEVGIWSYNGPEIYSAVKDAGKQGKVKIVAFDQEADTMTGVKDGTIYGAVVQQPYQVRLPVHQDAGPARKRRQERHSCQQADYRSDNCDQKRQHRCLPCQPGEADGRFLMEPRSHSADRFGAARA